MDPTTARFISSATALPADALTLLYEAFLDRWPQGGREGSRAARVSASEQSAIGHAVRSALLPRAAELEQVRKSLHSDSKSACVIAARAVHKRAKLTEAQYRALLDPFTAAGAAVPPRTTSSAVAAPVLTSTNSARSRLKADDPTTLARPESACGAEGTP
ncbi:hypothetical protein ACH4XT_36895 [Streptomyces avidinii]|uniref:hypothetical protein n=1 Tax=Streptomyces avidinii TaxID=1895 RepID=UPI0037AC3EED